VNELLRGERREEQWHGLAVSEGIVVGRVLRIQSGTRHVFRATLPEADVERETRRLRAAIRLARRELLAIRKRAERELGAEHAYIFDAHLLMLDDTKLLEEVEDYIRRERSNAEWAVKVAADQILSIYSEIKDDYLRERGSDIEDVTRRILAALSGERPQYSQLSEDAVIVAEDLLPSAVAELDFEHARGIVTDAGGWTSHTSIIARSLGIPAVVGLRDIHRRVRTGDNIIVDATRGEVYLHPSQETMERFRGRAQSIIESRVPSSEGSSGAFLTPDGVEIVLRANVELPAEYEGVRRFGAEGIGLYRSEFLLSHTGVLPSEGEQYKAYVKVGHVGGEKGATIRLFDLGGEKIGVMADEIERNPALGLRAIRFILREESILRTQVRAILRAAAETKLSLVLPMVCDIADIRRARLVINEERVALEKSGNPTGELKIGAMIEVPSAVMTIDSIAAEVDFLSLGTNDLVQYLLAVDRANEQVAEWFRSLHPAVIHSLKKVIDAAKKNSIPAVVCGEMAGTPAYAVILMGLGARELSMTASSIPRIRRTLRHVDKRAAEEVVEICLKCATSDEVEDVVREELGSRWPQVFTAKSLPAPRNSASSNWQMRQGSMP
jgi:phosphotransferase system enzyme I (PtsI)